MIPEEKKSNFKVGVSSGIYMAAHAAEMASVVRKLGYALTRGTDTIEIGGDVPHEVNFSDGKELRYIAEKQGLTLTFHGSLTLDLAMPERTEWRDAEDHMKKSIRSAVMGGCKYVNFHSCLNFWLELMTYAGRKLTMTFCDEKGRFISDMMKGDGGRRLREWFVKKKWETFGRDVLTDEENRAVSTPISVARDVNREQETLRLRQQKETLGWSEEEYSNRLTDLITRISNVDTKNSIEKFQDAIMKKLMNGGTWDSEEMRGYATVIDGYHIMAHHLYYSNDPIWQAMYEMYKDVIESPKYRTVLYRKGTPEENHEYTYNFGKPYEGVDYWLDAAWDQAEKDNDRNFKEFYYAVCAAKYIEGHIKTIKAWMEDRGHEGLRADIEKDVSDQKEVDKLMGFARDLKITLEIPDARSPEYAGLYLIARPKQIYAAVKTIWDTVGKDFLYMLIDAEHIATQGYDPLIEIQDLVKKADNVGKYILSMHVTKPSPLHHHMQVELGDIEVYKMLYALRTAGLGKEHVTYLIFERGGDQDPFRQSVSAIRLMVEYLDKDTKPEDLIKEPRFFGVEGPSVASYESQHVIIEEHTRDPLKGMLMFPEEEYGILGKAATDKPGGQEKWKKEEMH
jgi:sugar phosphate isomerase/epimerase